MGKEIIQQCHILGSKLLYALFSFDRLLLRIVGQCFGQRDRIALLDIEEPATVLDTHLQLFELEGFAYIVMRSCIEAGLEVCRILIGCDDNRRCRIVETAKLL